MLSPVPSSSRVTFGEFVLDRDAGELRRHGERVTIAEQPLRLLEFLLAHPGVLVTREQLQTELWTGDTFVDFEHGLNAAVKRLRDALDDSAENPRFIETVPKRGYRFIARVEGASSQALATLRPTARDWRGASKVAIAVAVVVIVVVAVWQLRSFGNRPVGTPMQFPLDAPPGQLYQLALSPDGKRLAVTSYDEELTEAGTAPLGVTVWVRRLDRPGWQRLPVLTRGFATWTRDSQKLMYAAEDGLRLIDVESAASQIVAPRGRDDRVGERDDRLGDVQTDPS